jgi:hypothetical protein
MAEEHEAGIRIAFRAALLLIRSEAAKILILEFPSMLTSQEVETETETDRGYLADDAQYGRRATRSVSQHDNYRNLQVCVFLNARQCDDNFAALCISSHFIGVLMTVEQQMVPQRIPAARDRRDPRRGSAAKTLRVLDAHPMDFCDVFELSHNNCGGYT